MEGLLFCMQIILMRFVYIFALLASAIALHTHAQSPADFHSKPQTKLAVSPTFLEQSGWLSYRDVAFMPGPMRFEIGKYKVMDVFTQISRDSTHVISKQTFRPGEALINGILNRRPVFPYWSGQSDVGGTQRYAYGFALQGYHQVLRVEAQALRHFAVQKIVSGTPDDLSQSETLQYDTSYLAAMLQLPDSTTWFADVSFYQHGDDQQVRGTLTCGDQVVHLQELVYSRDGMRINPHLNSPGLTFKSHDTLVAVVEFPSMTKGAVIVHQSLAMKDRQVIVACSAMLYAYWRLRTND